MALEIREHTQDGVVILALRGRLTMGDEVEAFRERVRTTFEAGHRWVAIDGAALDYIDSSGLGMLVYCHSKMAHDGGALHLFHLNERNLQLMIITKLTTVFELFDDEQQAINSFFPERSVRKFDIMAFVEQQRKRKAGA